MCEIWTVMVAHDDDEDWFPHGAIVAPEGASIAALARDVVQALTLTHHVWVGCLTHQAGAVFHQGGGCTHRAPLSPPVREPAL
jgi:hypothetical protein